MVKLLLFFVLVSSSVEAFSKVEKLTFNTDYFNCTQDIHTLFNIESKAGIYSAPNVDLALRGESLEQKMQNLLLELKKISPARARFIEELSARNQNVQFKKSIKILRSSPPSNLLLPEGCEVGIAAAITLSRALPGNFYTIVIDQDAYERFADEDKIYFWLTLAFDIEQASFALGRVDFRYNEVEIDLTRSRNFMACWFSSTSRPKSVASLHKIALKKEYSLPVLEQDGVVLLADTPIAFFEDTGLVKTAKKIALPFWGSPSEAFDSFARIKNKSYPIKQLSEQKNFLGFSKNGNLRCAPLLDVEAQFQNLKTIWSYSENGAYPVSFPLCWDEEGNITQGELRLEKDQSMKIPVAGSLLELNHYDPLSDGQYFGISFAFYDPQTIKWIFRARGAIKFNKQTIEIDGPLKLHPTGKISCVRFAKKASLIMNDGTRLNISDSEVRNDLFCFSEEGNFVKKYLYYDTIRLIADEFTLLK